MSGHGTYVIAAYLVSGVGLVSLIAWIVLDARAQTRALRDLEMKGVRRRSARVD